MGFIAMIQNKQTKKPKTYPTPQMGSNYPNLEDKQQSLISNPSIWQKQNKSQKSTSNYTALILDFLFQNTNLLHISTLHYLKTFLLSQNQKNLLIKTTPFSYVRNADFSLNFELNWRKNFPPWKVENTLIKKWH